jgi:1,4-alpha-glucan branching enzyme
MMYELTTARPGEKRIAYVESHDQALVGSQTLMFRMAGPAMYWDMNRENQNPVIDRAMALHKMARLITASAGAEGYLNFMGNEFGHPEWIDFPRAENGWSYQYSRRQWSLGDSDYLRYSDLKSFDKTMLHLLTEKKLMGGPVRILLVDQQRKLIAFEKKAHIFIFNFHPTESVPSLQLPLQGATASLRTLLDTDEIRFGGQGRIAHDVIYPIQDLPDYQEVGGIMIYVPCRTGLILS